MNKFIGIDLLRAFAAFAVFYYHQQLGFIATKYTGIQLLGYTDVLGSTYAVPLFFLLSGFCIHLSCLKQLTDNKPLQLKNYYLNRFFRIYPAYFFSLILSVIIMSIINPSLHISTSDLIVHLFNGQGFSRTYFSTINIVLWTITVEMAFYFIYPIYYYINRKWNANIALLFSLVVTGISIGLFNASGKELTFPQYLLFTNLWFGWCFGAWACDQYFRNPLFFKSFKWALMVIFIISLFIALHFIDYTQGILLKNISYILIWSPILIFVMKQENHLVKIKKWLKIPIAIGLSSYSLYLLHEPLIAIKNYLISSFIDQKYNSLVMVFGTLLIPVICYFNYQLIEIPFLKLRRNFTKAKPHK